MDLDLTSKSDKRAALARRLLKSEIKRMMRHSKFKALSTWECLELLLDSMENGTSQYRHQVWELREELQRIFKTR
jgi:hypothetical protein